MRQFFVLLSAAAVLAAGCGGGSTAAVSGVINLDGKPVEGASVSFTPASGDGDGVGGSYGKTDAQGRYSLRTVAGDKPGAAAGKHKVTVSMAKSNPGSDRAVTDLIPARYNTQSDLTFDVPPSGTDKADFELVGGKK